MKKCLFSTRIYKNDYLEESALIEEDIIKFNQMKRKAYALTVLTKDKSVELEQSVHLQVKELFNANDYYTNSAVQEASAKYKNIQENHKLHLAALEEKIKRMEKKLKDTHKAISNKEKVLASLISLHKVIKLNKETGKSKALPKFKTYPGAVEKLEDVETLTFSVRKGKNKTTYNIYTFEVCYLKPLIKQLKHRAKMVHHRLERSKQKLERLKNSKPTVCFGSKHLFTLQHSSYKLNHKAWKKKWHTSRHRQMIISGRKDAVQGNFVFRYDIAEHQLNWTTMRGVEITLPNVKFPYGQEWLNQALQADKKDRRSIAWAIEDHGDYFIIKVIIDIPKPKSKDLNSFIGNGIVATDINVDHLALVDIDKHGNLLEQKIISFDLTGKTTTQATAIIEQVAIEAVKFATDKKKPFAREELDLRESNRKLLYNHKKLNAKLSSFAYSKIIDAVDNRAVKEKIAIYTVNPAFTSQIGKVKYMKQKGLSIHIAAAYTIARRAIGMKEQVPTDLKQYVPEKNLRKHHWSHWRYLSTQLKSVHPKYFYKEVPREAHASLKEYVQALTIEGV